MREIKFRVWDKGAMHNVQRLIWSGLTDELFAYDDGASRDLLNASSLMQYTGLKDKNGKEIYEGDIVTFTDPQEQDEEVDWRLSLHGEPIEIKRDSRGFYPFTVASAGIDVDHVYPTEPKFIEVIGNIYENPELMK